MKKYIITSLLTLGLTPQLSWGGPGTTTELNDSNKVRIYINDDSIVVNMDEITQGLMALGEELDKVSKEINHAPVQVYTNPNKEHLDPDTKDSYITAKDGLDLLKAQKSKSKKFKFNFLMMDVGINGFQDNTNYNSAAAEAFVRLPDDKRNARAFDIRNGQSRNFNLWPLVMSYDLAHRSRNQRVLLSVGIPGFQFYSFKYNNPIQFQDGFDPHVIETGENYRKNKLGVTYLSIPVSITGQTKVTKSKWLTYGVGVIGGYRIASWTNQKVHNEQKVKVKDPFNLNDYQLALTGEIGIKGVLRLYGTYNLTNMWEDALDQNIFAVGIRFFGI